MKLELKHLAPYLPYGLKGIEYHGSMFKFELTEVITGYGLKNTKFVWELRNGEKSRIDCKPILRPLSELTSAFIYNCGVNGGFDELHTWGSNYSKGEKQDVITTKGVSYASYDDFQILFSMHFDVFGLIDAGLAIDINTLNY